MPVRRSLVAVVLASLLVGFGLSACAKARHVAVVADATFAQSVFALDDAELSACQTHVLTDTQCASLNPLLREALVDVKVVTAAIQASPSSGVVPSTLPGLLKSLEDIQAIVGPLSSAGGTLGVLASTTSTAMNQAIAVLSAIAGAR